MPGNDRPTTSRQDDDPSNHVNDRPSDHPMFALAGVRAAPRQRTSMQQREQEAFLDAIAARQPFMAQTAVAHETTERHAEIFAQHGMYVAGSGNLLQFNSIMSAILAATVSTVELQPVRAVATIAMLLHVTAAIVFCWATRPIYPKTALDRMYQTHERLANDTFKVYRKGWRLTMVGAAVSAIALLSFTFKNRDGLFAGLFGHW